MSRTDTGVTSRKQLHIGIVAGEVSGDMLGAGLVRALSKYPVDIRFSGIAGPAMQALGCESRYPMERLTVMGLEGLFGRVREIFCIRRNLKNYFIDQPPDLFVGIDAPDFNLVLEKHLRRAGIPVVHYVSPTVWAWRGYRIRLIRKAVDMMLALFPFEVDYYHRHDVPVTLVGHPMVREIQQQPDVAGLKQELGITPGKRIIALMPGSRRSEIDRLAGDFLEGAKLLADRYPDIQFVSAMPSEELMQALQHMKRNMTPELDLVCIPGRSRDVMACADVVLLASGTAALEAAIIGRPMVVAYKVSGMTKLMVKLFASVDYYSMPNHLAGRAIVPELMQDECTAGNICREVSRYLEDAREVKKITALFTEIRQSLDMDASANAAAAIASMLNIEPPEDDVAPC